MTTTKIKFNLKENNFDITTDLEEDQVVELVENFIKMQMGKDADPNRPIEREEYIIDIMFDIENNTFTSTDDCGSYSLRDGILLYFLQSAAF